jgi:hypothetical protein
VAEHAASAAAVAAAATAFAAALAAEAACERVAERGGSVERETAVAVGPGRCRRPASASWKRARCPRSSRSRRRSRLLARSSSGIAARLLRWPRLSPETADRPAPKTPYCEPGWHKTPAGLLKFGIGMSMRDEDPHRYRHCGEESFWSYRLEPPPHVRAMLHSRVVRRNEGSRLMAVSVRVRRDSASSPAGSERHYVPTTLQRLRAGRNGSI